MDRAEILGEQLYFKESFAAAANLPESIILPEDLELITGDWWLEWEIDWLKFKRSTW